MTSDLNDSDLIPVSLHGNDVEPLPAAAVSDAEKSTCHPGEGVSQAGEKAPAAAAAGTLHAPGDEETRGEPDRNQPPDHSADCSSDMRGDRSVALQQKDGAQNSDKEDTGSGSGSGSGGRCADHESQLDWYCSTEDRLICSHCAATGTCKSHTVTPVFKKAADMRGLFAVYKPPGVHWKLVRDTVETSLIRDLNSLGSPAPRQAIRFLPGRCEGTDRSELTLTATRLPVLTDHPLVKGPEFHRLKVGVGHRLDVRSSGVFVLGVGHGNKLLTDMYSCHLPKEYTLQGLFGKATDDFSDSGRLIEKTTFDHISRDKLEKILAVIQGTNQKALLAFSGVDLKSQEAYELAVKGLLRPLQKTPPIITGVRCVRFAPPEFTLEIQCLNETPQYLRKLIHEIGLELRSAAVCSHVRRTRDGFFTLPDALLRSHWDLRSVGEAVRQAGPRVRAALSRGEAEPEPGQG